MAVVVGTDLAFFNGATTGVSHCDTITDWATDATLYSVTDFFVQGVGSLAIKISAATGTTKFTIAGADGVNLTGKIVVFWAADLEVKKLDTIALGGLRLLLEDTSLRTRVWYLAGKDTWHGGWTPFVVQADKTPEPGLGSDTAGFDVTKVKKVGIVWKHTALLKLTPNCHWDAVRYGTGLTIKGETAVGGGTTTRARASNVATITTASAHGLAVGGSIRIRNLGGTGYNGAWTVATVPTTTTFTYANPGTNESATSDTSGIVATPATFQHLLDAEVANTAAGADFGPNWGVISKDRGVIFVQGKLTFGSTVNAAGEETYFGDKDQLIVFPSRPVLTDFYGLALQGSPHASSPTDIYFGDPVTEVGGLVIKAESITAPFKLTASDTNITKFGFYGCNFFNAGRITGQAYNANKKFSKCNFVQCSRVDPDAGIVDECNFVGTLDYEPILGAVAEGPASTFVEERTAANNDTLNDMTLLRAAPAVNDAYYFGSSQRFPRLRIKQDTPGAGTWVITWEYWNGSTWTALSNISDGTAGFRPASAGTYTVSYTFPSNWASNIVLGVTAFWIRGRVSSYTSITTQPKGTRAWTWNRALLISSTSHYVANSNFINCGAAIYHNVGGPLETPAHYDYDNLKFSGGTYHIENSAVTPNYYIDIHRLNGSNPDANKLFNSGGGTTTLLAIYNPVYVKVVDINNNPVYQAQVAIYRTSDNYEIINTDTNASGEVSTTYNGTADIYIRIRKSSTGTTKYVPIDASGSITASGYNAKFTFYADTIADPSI